MKRLSSLIVTLFFITTFLTACSSTQNTAEPMVYSNFEDCTPFEYNPLQVKEPVRRGINLGSAFYLGKKYGKHIFVTNAHVTLKGDSNEYYNKIILLDKNRNELTTTIVATREIHIFTSYGPDKSMFDAKRIADIAILEAEKLPNGFMVTPVILEPEEQRTTFADGIDYKNRRWNGCFELAQQGQTPLALSENKRAIQSFSGTPVFNTKKEVIGIITASGSIIRGKKRIPLYVDVQDNGEVIIRKNPSERSKPLFAILTPTAEVRKLLNETYSDTF